MASILTSSASSPRITSLSVHDVTCVRGDRLVLAGLTFDVTAGQTVLVRGPNGAGKSTLLRVLADLVDIRQGTLTLTGDGITEDAMISEYAHYIGHLDAVKPNFTVRENLQFWADYFGGGAGSLDSAMATFNLTDLADLPAQFLSAGQKKRTALARLRVAPRPIWLLDEPTASLDSETRNALLAAIDAHLDQSGIVVMTTHEDVHLKAMTELRLNSVPRHTAFEEDLI